MRATFLLISLLFGQAAFCETNTVTDQDGHVFPSAPTAFFASPDPSMDRRAIPTPAQAAEIFNRACIDRLPSFAGTGRTLTKLGLVLDPKRRVFDSRTLDLSVALVDNGGGVNCSIIFGTNLDPKTVADQIAAYGVSKHQRFYVEVIGQTADRVYLNAQVAGQ